MTERSNWPWRKSSRSPTLMDCVELALVSDTVAVRDSKVPVETLCFPSGQFASLIGALNANRIGSHDASAVDGISGIE